MENKCNTDKRALLIGLWAHRFRYIIGSKKGVKMSGSAEKKGRVEREFVNDNLLNLHH